VDPDIAYGAEPRHGGDEFAAWRWSQRFGCGSGEWYALLRYGALVQIWALMQFAARSLVLERRRTFISIVGIALTVLSLASITFLRSSLTARAEVLRAFTPDLTVQRLVLGRPAPIQRAYQDSIRTIPGVRDVHTRVWGFLFAPALQGNVVVVGTGSDASKVSLTAGRDVAASGEMVVGDALAKALGLRLGDTLALPPLGGQPIPLKVVGVLSLAEDAYAGDVVLTTEADARSLLALADTEVSDIAVNVTHRAETPVIARTIGDLAPGLRTVSRDASARIAEAAYGRRSGLFLASTLPALLILLLLFADRITMSSTRERRAIAIQKAVGWSTEEVVYTKVFESLLLASLGTAVGLSCAYIYVFVLQAPGLRNAIAGVTALSPAMQFAPNVGIAELLGLLAVGLVPLCVASLIPSWRISSSDPVAVLRGE
jgi:ABC-type lipoprotein release transport system permease subunit